MRMARRALGKPPAYIARRALQELQGEAERFLGPRRARAFGTPQLLTRTRAQTISELWQRLAARPYVALVEALSKDTYEAVCPGDAERILAAAQRALEHRVDLLGSGPIDLGADIDWHKDYKSGFRWPPQYCRDIDYMNPGRPSDVKFPWELSRMQWLIPCGQAYLLTGDERWAAGARRIIEHWIAANPYAASVNWSCTMEVALRILTCTWLFHACASSAAWSDEHFRSRFLCSLWLHADFTDRHIEYADVNGNHCDADAAGLVFAGLFFGTGGQPRGWLERGWKILCDELPRQVSEDGVDFEGSVPYHRLVAELFLLPAAYRMRCGLPVPEAYRDRVLKMAWFTEAYTRPDGTAPVWGDADDARALPFGGQPVNDHRYLLGWISEAFGDADLASRFTGDGAECAWLLGSDALVRLIARAKPSKPPQSVLFAKGGYAILRNEKDHVFIDCGPVGTAGRGGHGHNDVLSFEAHLAGTPLVVDRGAYVYTADFEARNAFRSTEYHNTPRVDEQEVNRFLGPNDLWWLCADAEPNVHLFRSEAAENRLVASHTGYLRLSNPVQVTRTFVLRDEERTLTIRDEFTGAGIHRFEVALHFAPSVCARIEADHITLSAGEKSFSIEPSSHGHWSCSIDESSVSSSYGRLQRSSRVVWRRMGATEPFEVRIKELA